MPARLRLAASVLAVAALTACSNDPSPTANGDPTPSVGTTSSATPTASPTATATATATTASKKKKSAKRKTYTVKSGDTASGIAEKTGVDLQTLYELNPELDPSSLAPGQKIKLSE